MMDGVGRIGRGEEEREAGEEGGGTPSREGVGVSTGAAVGDMANRGSTVSSVRRTTTTVPKEEEGTTPLLNPSKTRASLVVDRAAPPFPTLLS